ncbi:MAG: STAS domain-containing protein [Nitrospira sp.]
MAIQMRRHGNSVILDIPRDMQFARRKAFPEAIAQGLALEPQWLLCDLRNLADIDSSGLAMLLIAAEQCRKTPTRLGIICDNVKTSNYLRIANLHTSVRFFSSETETDGIPAAAQESAQTPSA